jgi:hypothetical protein
VEENVGSVGTELTGEEETLIKEILSQELGSPSEDPEG